MTQLFIEDFIKNSHPLKVIREKETITLSGVVIMKEFGIKSLKLNSVYSIVKLDLINNSVYVWKLDWNKPKPDYIEKEIEFII